MSPVLEKEGALYVFIRATRWSDLLNDIKKNNGLHSVIPRLSVLVRPKDRVLRDICRTAMCIKRNSRHALLEKKKTNSIPIVINKAGWVSFIWCPLYVIKYRVVQNVI